MSYSLIGHFVDVKNKKEIVSADLGFMKNLNSRSYSAEFNDIESTSDTKKSDYPEVTIDVNVEFYGYYYKDILNESSLIDKFTVKSVTFKSNEKGYVIDKDFIENNKAIFEKYVKKLSLEEIVNDKELSYNDTILVYYRENIENSGIWYRLSDFADAERKLKGKCEDAKKRIEKLESMKDTYEWFKLDEDARNRILEELSYAYEDSEDCEYKYYAIVKMNNILDFIKNDVGFKYKGENGETRYKWEYEDKRDIEVFIEVC